MTPFVIGAWVLFAGVVTVWPPIFWHAVTDAPLLLLILLAGTVVSALDALDVRGRDLMALFMRLETMERYIMADTQPAPDRRQIPNDPPALDPPYKHDLARLPSPKCKAMAKLIEDNLIAAQVQGARITPIGETVGIKLLDDQAGDQLKGIEPAIAFAIKHGDFSLDIKPEKRAAFLIVRDEKQKDLTPDLLGKPNLKKHEIILGAASHNGFPLKTEMGTTTVPHVGLAGTTGSGKSTFLRYLLAQIVGYADPRQARLLLIDPKREDLLIFENAPHLVAPVICEKHEAEKALAWCCDEMRRRQNQGIYTVKGHLFVVLEEWGNLGSNGSKSGQSDVFHLASELLRQGRSAGITLIVAMQRPTPEISTPEFKSLLPARIAFDTGDKNSSRAFIGTDAAAGLPTGVGVFSSKGKLTEFKAPLFTSDQVNTLVGRVAAKAQQLNIRTHHVPELAELGQSSASAGRLDADDEFLQWLIDENITSLRLTDTRRRLGISQRQAEKKHAELAAMGFATLTKGKPAQIHLEAIRNHLHPSDEPGDEPGVNLDE